MIWRIFDLLVWTGLCKKLGIYRVPPDALIWSCQYFGSLWQSFVMSWVIFSNNELKVSHRKQVKAPLNMNFATSWMNFKCQTCRTFEGLSHHQEDESIYPTTFADSVGLGDLLKELFLLTFMAWWDQFHSYFILEILSRVLSSRETL